MPPAQLYSSTPASQRRLAEVTTTATEAHPVAHFIRHFRSNRGKQLNSSGPAAFQARALLPMDVRQCCGHVLTCRVRFGP
jgi:hypothetical protein